jgi:hypothetical protein
MTRLARFVTACALTAVVTGAAIAACRGAPGSPGELPPMAPHPERADPTTPLRRPTTALPALIVPTPEFAPVVSDPPVDAGTSDGYTPPLPPLPDGSVPADGRMEPRLSD